MKIIKVLTTIVILAFAASCGVEHNSFERAKVPNPAIDKNWQVASRNSHWIVFERSFGLDSPSKIVVAKFEDGKAVPSADFSRYSEKFYSDDLQVIPEPSFYGFNEEGFPVVAFGSLGHKIIKR